MALVDQLRAVFAPPVKRLVQDTNGDRSAVTAISELGEPDTEVAIHVVEDTDVFETEDGEQIWCGGYAPVDEWGLYLREADHRTSDPRAFYCHVAGVTFRPEALADPRFAHGSPVMLVPEPDNPGHPDAVGVWDADGEIQVGYVPATLSAEVAELMRSGTTLVGRVMREFRRESPDGKRLGIHIVVYPVGRVIYLVHDED